MALPLAASAVAIAVRFVVGFWFVPVIYVENQMKNAMDKRSTCKRDSKCLCKSYMVKCVQIFLFHVIGTRT